VPGLWGGPVSYVRDQANADMSDPYSGLVYDTSHGMLYYDTGSSGFAIAQIHTADHALVADRISVEIYYA